MIIIKFKRGKKLDKYALYKRLSFREDGKVKKKDIYITTLNERQVKNKSYLDLELSEEIEQAFNRFFDKQKKKNEEKCREVEYRSGLIGKLWSNREEFEKVTWNVRQVPLDYLKEGYDYDKYNQCLKDRYTLK